MITLKPFSVVLFPSSFRRAAWQSDYQQATSVLLMGSTATILIGVAVIIWTRLTDGTYIREVMGQTTSRTLYAAK